VSTSPLPRVTRNGPAEPVSFDAVYRAHAAVVARWAKRLGGPDVDSDETVQDVFLTVGRKLASFRGDAKLETWLFRITARIAANRRRQARRRQVWVRITRQIEQELASDGPGPVEALEKREAARRFYAVLDDLPERHREVLVLFELEELSTDEIARLIERPAATVRVWLHRARARFTEGWRRRQQEEEQ
jgi:RNA polymerase sigma-70 factor (ECF subfamily)